MSAVHVLRVEASLSQFPRGAAADVETVSAIHDDGFRLRKLSHPILHALRIAPRNAICDVLLTRERVTWSDVDHLHAVLCREHLLDFFDADARNVCKLLLNQRARRSDRYCILVATFHTWPIDVAKEGIDVRL